MLTAIILPYVDDNAVDFAVALHSKVCKSTVLVFTLLFAIMFRLQKATWQLALVITLIFGGVVLFLAKSTGGDPIDGLGFLLVMIASVMGGLRWVLAQILIERGGKKRVVFKLRVRYPV